MNFSKGQGELFDNSFSPPTYQSHSEINLSKQLIKDWQNRIIFYQENLFKGIALGYQQVSLFPSNANELMENFQPLMLTPLPLSFWRWPNSSHSGPAIYIVMDRPDGNEKYLMLYIGETVAAEQRWKGEHDCKAYLSNYCEALRFNGIQSQLSIRFWTDVPKKTKARRKLEQDLIQRWLPPFNKETRNRWETPFTAEIN